MSEDFLPIARPHLSDDEIAEVVDTLRSGWLTLGPRTQQLEEAFARQTGASHAIGVNSCTAGMHIALLASDIGRGDEVITSSLTFAATANVIVHTGATPVLADVCRDDLTIDPEQVERHITPRTKAIMPVDYAGHPCRMDEILAIAGRHGLKVIEDAATAAGATYKGRPIGSMGDATAFSFYAIKNMTTGEGGMVTTEKPDLAERLRALRNQGMDANAWSRYSVKSLPYYSVSEPGFNYRMMDLQAAIGLHQLARLPEFNRRRTELARRYTGLLAEVPEVELPRVSADVESNWHLYVIRLRLETLTISRNDFIEALKKRGVGSAVHYLPIHYHPYYQANFDFKAGDYPVVEREFERLISLPLFPQMTAADVERVVHAIEEIVHENHA